MKQLLPALFKTSIHFRLIYKSALLVILLLQLSTVTHAQVTEIYTDFGGYWKSTNLSPNPVIPNLNNNVLAFKYNTVIYSTGVNNAVLTSNTVPFVAASFKALPVTSIGGTITGGTSTYIATPSFADGITSGFASPLPSLRMADVLTDGINGLNIGTGVTNVPLTALLNFPIVGIVTDAITDTKPDILFSQIAAPSSTVDSLYFANSSGAIVGNRVAIPWMGLAVLGSYTCDLYNLSNGTCDAATITSGNSHTQSKDIRLQALQFSDFGITTSNYTSVVKLVLKPGGTSDPAFVAYNTDAFTVESPVITTHPQSQVICPGTSNNVTFTVVATGSFITYQWVKNGVPISGATGTSYTITNVAAADAGSYEVIATNSGGSVSSSIAYLNIAITSQPTPATQTVATGNTVVLSVASTNATGFQWKRNGADISGATLPSYSISPLTTSNDGSYTVSVKNSAGGGCANILSSAAVVTAATTLYSKSSGILSVAANWGVATNGTGSTPVDFSRAEHTFIVANQTTPATGGNIAIAGTLDLKNAVTAITAGTTLSAARIIRTGTGTLSGNSTASLTVSGVSALNFTPGSQVIKNVTIAGGTVTLNTHLAITGGTDAGALVISAGTFNTSDSLTLKSDADGTAMIGTSAGTINGKITIERYMPARRAWRLMASPISTTGAPTINAAWQEGALTSTANPAPGYGTHITGGTTANGFDQSPPNSTSLKYYTGTSWLPIPNTTTIKTTDYPGYMFFVRGNRAYDILSTTAVRTPMLTVLRVTGAVNQGTQTAKPVAATGYTLLGNPYASPINFSLIAAASTNIKNRFTVWDPQLGGTNGVGGYVLLDWNGTAYTSTPSTSLDGIIQAGQAFFAESSDGTTAGSLVINESHKNTATSTIPFGKVASRADASMAIDLAIVNSDSTNTIADGVLLHYNDGYSDSVDRQDALKFKNSRENLAIMCGQQPLIIERHTMPADKDTVRLRLTGLQGNSYQLNIKPENFSSTSLNAYLYDALDSTAIPINNGLLYPFAITADTLSAAATRFSILYKTKQPLVHLPISIVQIKATNDSDTAISIDWVAGNDKQAASYEVQKENKAGSFVTIGKLAAKHTTTTAAYHFTDTKALQGNNLYRVKAAAINGETVYSINASAYISRQADGISILPNLVTGNTINISCPKAIAGNYRYTITSHAGQVVANGIAALTSGQASCSIRLPETVAPGKYSISLLGTGKAYKASFVLINK